VNNAMFESYDAYKDSGVEWLGDVPEHWILNRHKDNFGFVTDRCTNSSLAKIGLENIEGKTGRFISTDSEFDGDGVKFEKNDILFGKLRPYLAKVYLAEFNGNAVGDIFVYRPKKSISSNFAQYLMLSDRYIDVINSSTAGAKMPRVSSNFIANLPISTPPIKEQIAISAYLDTKTAQIDCKIDLLNQKAAQYGKLKQSLINEIVTRGLDKTVAMKDSGVEWIGEMPTHWNLQRIKDLSTLQSGNSIVSEQIEETGLYPVYGGNGLRGYFSEYTNDGDYILIGRQGALCGNINYASGKFWASEHAVVAYLNRSINIKWYGEILRVMNLNQYSVSAAQPGLAVDRIKRLLLPVPPFSEQTAIAKYLDEKTVKINQIITTINTQIDKLKELRKTLINEVVTGKICVLSESVQDV